MKYLKLNKSQVMGIYKKQTLCFLQIVEDWKYVSMVLDRFFLWVFTLACIGGTCGIIFQAPSLYDKRVPIDQQRSTILWRGNNFQVPHSTDIPRIE
jgi:nicotinic acetylcholine receptor